MELKLKEGAEPLSMTPSVLLRQAIGDVRAVQKMPGYVLDMEHWYNSSARSLDGRLVCLLCFAGATLANRMCMDDVWFISPDRMMLADRKQLMALNWFRQGVVNAGLRKLGVEPSDYDVPHHFNITNESASTTEEIDVFLAEMEDLAKILEVAGL